MAVLGKFVAFEAAVALVKETGQEQKLNALYLRAKEELKKPKEEQVNLVKEIYAPFSDEQVSEMIARLIKPAGLNAELQIIYQGLDGLHNARPNHKGDWYFSGNHPTPGGNKVSKLAFVNYMEGSSKRAY